MNTIKPAIADLGEFVMIRTRTLPFNLRLFGLVLCGLLLSACSSPDGPAESFYENGQLWSRSTIGDEDGVFELFYENGQLRTRENWKNWQKDGLHENFYENGQLQRRGNYKPDPAPYPDNTGGMQDGLWEIFHENGQLEARANFIDGEQDGLWEEFNEDGNLTETRTYRNGELVEENLNP